MARTTDPYANAASPFQAAPTPSTGAMRGAGKAAGNPLGLTPEQMEALLGRGFSLDDAGGIVPPADLLSAPAAAPMPPPPPGLAGEASMWENPIFAPHMAIRNPAPAPTDPLAGLMPTPEATPAPRNVAVPGGASINGGMPRAAGPLEPASGPRDMGVGQEDAPRQMPGRLGRKQARRTEGRGKRR